PGFLAMAASASAPSGVISPAIPATRFASPGPGPAGLAFSGAVPPGVAPSGPAPSGFAPPGVAPPGFAPPGVALAAAGPLGSGRVTRRRPPPVARPAPSGSARGVRAGGEAA